MLTDGDTFFENGESMNGSKTEERLEEELTRCNAAENVMYLGIGSVAVMPKVSAGKNVYYADKATTTAEILTKLTAMSNMIFGRDELKLSGDTLEFDLPMSKLILFVQGSGVGDVTLTGSEGKQLNAVSQYAPPMAPGAPGSIMRESVRWIRACRAWWPPMRTATPGPTSCLTAAASPAWASTMSRTWSSPPS